MPEPNNFKPKLSAMSVMDTNSLLVMKESSSQILNIAQSEEQCSLYTYDKETNCSGEEQKIPYTLISDKIDTTNMVRL